MNLISDRSCCVRFFGWPPVSRDLNFQMFSSNVVIEEFVHRSLRDLPFTNSFLTPVG